MRRTFDAHSLHGLGAAAYRELALVELASCLAEEPFPRVIVVGCLRPEP